MININDLLQQGENTAIEFKEIAVRAESLAREIVAFANTYGGTLLLNVATEFMRLFQQSGVFHYDAIALENTDIKQLNSTKIAQYFDNYQVDFAQEEHPEILLKNTDILTEQYQVTIAGLLIFGLNPQKFIPSACISFAHFSGNDISEELIDKQVITGTLDYQIDTALAIIKNNTLAPSLINGSRTELQKFNYPDKVFRELLVNACVHRNYAISGSRIRIFMFDNRIEFISPGKLPNTVTIEKLVYGVSYSIGLTH
jgi:ATP-dependent DNA helicase RecG